MILEDTDISVAFDVEFDNRKWCHNDICSYHGDAIKNVSRSCFTLTCKSLKEWCASLSPTRWPAIRNLMSGTLSNGSGTAGSNGAVHALTTSSRVGAIVGWMAFHWGCDKIVGMGLPCQRFTCLITRLWLTLIFQKKVTNYRKGTAPLGQAHLRRHADRLQQGCEPTPAHCTIYTNGMPADFEVVLSILICWQCCAGYLTRCGHIDMWYIQSIGLPLRHFHRPNHPAIIE